VKHSNSTSNKEIKKFGLIALVFFGCLCVLGLWMRKPLPTYFFGFLSFLGLFFILMPSRLKPIYKAWLKTSQFINKLVTVLILTLLYYMAITPLSVIKRIFGGRPLPFKPDSTVSSYWVDRTEPSQPKERFLKRY